MYIRDHDEYLSKEVNYGICNDITQKGSDNYEKRILLPPVQNRRFEVKAIVFRSSFYLPPKKALISSCSYFISL